MNIKPSALAIVMCWWTVLPTVSDTKPVSHHWYSHQSLKKNLKDAKGFLNGWTTRDYIQLYHIKYISSQISYTHYFISFLTCDPKYWYEKIYSLYFYDEKKEHL